PLQAQLAAMIGRQLQAPVQKMAKSMPAEVRQQWEDLGKQMAEFDHLKPPALPAAMGTSDVGPVAPATHLLQRGDWRKPAEEVTPGYPTALDASACRVPTPAPESRSTGRRSALARWLTRPDHPLTARVMMNRLWQHHIGRGLVATPSDFGVQGEP